MQSNWLDYAMLGALGLSGGLLVLFCVLVIWQAVKEWYPFAWLKWKLGRGAWPARWKLYSVWEAPKINPNAKWKVNVFSRLSAKDNRLQKKIYLRVLDDKGEPLEGIKVRFDTEPSYGMAYDHLNIWGLTGNVRGNLGYLEWEHLGKPTRYVLWMENDEDPLIEDIRTDLGNEYPADENGNLISWRPGNTPGFYSYRGEIQMKGEGD